MHAKNETSALVLAFLCTVCVAGCSEAEKPDFLDQLIPATGRVTLDGKPLAMANVTFIPDVSVEGGRAATAVTDADGMYELVTSLPGTPQEQPKGVLPGEYVVVISKLAMPDGTPLPKNLGGADALDQGAVESVPAKYNDPSASTLKATVAPPKAENNFEL